jgi:hypothetical protein
MDLQLRAGSAGLGEPEVQDLRVAPRRDEDVRRLDVPVDEAAGMRRIEGVGDLGRPGDELVRRDRPAVDPLLERGSFEKLHHDERPTLVIADVEDAADVRVAERGGGAGLTLLQVLLGQELERDLASEPCVLGLVHDAHASAAQPAEDAVVRDRFSDHLSRRRLAY